MDLQSSSSYQLGKNEAGFTSDKLNCCDVGFFLVKLDFAMPYMFSLEPEYIRQHIKN